MKKNKFDLALGGFFLGASACAQPYDFENIILLGLGLLWVASAWIEIPNKP